MPLLLTICATEEFILRLVKTNVLSVSKGLSAFERIEGLFDNSRDSYEGGHSVGRDQTPAQSK